MLRIEYTTYLKVFLVISAGNIIHNSQEELFP